PERGHAHIGFTVPGGLAEYASVPLAAVHPLPANVNTREGAWTDNLGVSLWALERGRLKAGERVVVFGSGAIGLCTAQLARALGGSTGTGVELSGVDLSTIVRGHLDVLGSVANPMGVSGRALALLARGLVDVRALTTHHFALERFAEAWQTFRERREGAIRVM